MFVRDGAVTPGPSRECDITFFVKGRPKSARQSRDSTVAARRVQSVTVPSSRVSSECRSPGLTLTLQSLLFLISLLFLFSDFPCFFLRFSFLFQGFQEFREERNPCFFGEKPLLFPKKQGLEGQGRSPPFKNARFGGPQIAFSGEDDVGQR